MCSVRPVAVRSTRGVTVTMGFVRVAATASQWSTGVLERSKRSAGIDLRNPDGCALLLELVEKAFLKDDVLGPDVVLIMGQEIAKSEVLGDSRVLIGGGDFYEPFGILVRFGLDGSSFLFGPETNPVVPNRSADLVAEGAHRNQGESAQGAGASDFLNGRYRLHRVDEVPAENRNGH
jgi:hypothetical protein